MRKIRVLIVDDAVVVRRLIGNVLSDDPMLEVVGVAANGRIAMDKIAQLKPDVVTLDIEMPVMDGLETLAEIRKSHQQLPVIMFSTLTERGAAATLDALALGASDYVTKPANVGSVTAAMECLREDLIPKIKAHCSGLVDQKPVEACPSPVSQPVKRQVQQLPRCQERVDIVAIGVSTGGPNALAEVIPRLPEDFPVPVVVVQHMPALFTKLLAKRLDEKSAVQVQEGASNTRLESGHVWLAPGEYHMGIDMDQTGIRLCLHQDPPENSCRPAVDVLFRSVAKAYGPHVLAVIMTGMGQDGLLGCECIRSAGGQVIIQDEASSVVWGMPGAVARTGLADQVLPLDQLAAEIVNRVQYRRAGSAVASVSAETVKQSCQ